MLVLVEIHAGGGRKTGNLFGVAFDTFVSTELYVIVFDKTQHMGSMGYSCSAHF